MQPFVILIGNFYIFLFASKYHRMERLTKPQMLNQYLGSDKN